jgi:hypothetical protein
MPEGFTVSMSTGNTIAPESDPRPAVSTLGDDLIRAFSTLKVR